MKVALVGLDGLDPDLVARHLDRMPNLRGLMEQGLRGTLATCHPPITVPAWAVLTSGRDPGELGFTGFRNLRRGTYAETTVDARAVGLRRVWDLAGEAGRRVIVHGVPPAWPPRVVNGVLTSCFLAPGPEDGWAYPPKLEEDLAAAVGGDVLLDVPDYRRADRASLHRDLVRYAHQRFDLAEHLLRAHPWDLFAMVDMSVDRLHHAFLGDDDVVADHYALVDARLGRLLALFPPDAAVLVASDHGATPLAGAFAVNDWLRKEGLLVLRDEPTAPRPFSPDEVDWERTTAWAMGGYYARIFVNLRGREPRGSVAPSDLDSTVRDIASRLRAVRLPDGAPMGNRALAGKEAWRGPHAADAPDLVLYLGDLAWRATQGVGRPSLFEAVPEVGPDRANHGWRGVFALRAPGVRPQERDVDIYDVAPTLLDLLGVPAPSDLRGRSVLR